MEVGGTRIGIGRVIRRGAGRGRGVTVPDYHWIVVGADKWCSS